MMILTMYICLCKGITDHQIKDAVDAGAQSFKDVRKALGVATQCGKCACMANGIIKDHVEQQLASPQIYYAIA